MESSARLSVGPTALTALMVGSALTGLAQPGSADWVNLAVWLALLTGLTQMLLGFAGFGWLLNIISAPVLMGFTQAAALLILTSQLPAMLGFKGNFYSMAGQIWSQISHQHMPVFHNTAALFWHRQLGVFTVSQTFCAALSGGGGVDVGSVFHQLQHWF